MNEANKNSTPTPLVQEATIEGLTRYTQTIYNYIEKAIQSEGHTPEEEQSLKEEVLSVLRPKEGETE